MKAKDHPLAREVEQMSPERVQWMFDKGYATKDKQATRLTAAGEQWLRDTESLTATLLERVQKGISNV